MKERLINKDEEDDGYPLPSEVSEGPSIHRRCNDILFFLLFILFWAGLIIIAGVAVNNGNPKRLASPFDSSGNQCGYGETSSYPYMFFNVNIQISTSISQYACVKSCPTAIDSPIQCYPNEVITSCNQLIPYQSTEAITVCLPTNTASLDSLSSQLEIGTVEQWMSDIKTTWPIELSVVFIAFALSIIFLLLMRAFTGFITWAMIVAYFALLITLGILCLNKANNTDSSQTTASFQNQKILKGMGYSLLACAGISFLLFLCFFNKIRKAIAVMKAASDFTREVWEAFIVPIIMFILLCGFLTFWIIISLYIYSSGEIQQSTTSPFGSVQWNEGVKRCLIYYLFGLFWNIEFLLGMNTLIIGSCAALWYFSHRNGSSLTAPVSLSLIRGFTYHIGSVCFGSMLVSIVSLIRFFVELAYNQMKKNVSSNKAATCLLRCALCCVRYFENFIRFVSTNAYMMIGLTGNSFCGAAKEIFFLFSRNAAQFAVTKGIGKIFVFFGKLFICASSSFIGYLLITHIDTYSEKIYSPGAPVLVFVIISYVVGSIFMNIYGIAADTLLMCFCSDKELNRGNAKSCPPAVKEFESKHMN